MAVMLIVVGLLCVAQLATSLRAYRADRSAGNAQCGFMTFSRYNLLHRLAVDSNTSSFSIFGRPAKNSRALAITANSAGACYGREPRRDLLATLTRERLLWRSTTA